MRSDAAGGVPKVEIGLRIGILFHAVIATESLLLCEFKVYLACVLGLPLASGKLPISITNVLLYSKEEKRKR
jgi:hypothetical protein